MVGVEVGNLVREHHVPQNGCHVDGAECERFEAEKSAEFCFSALNDEHGVLNADTMFASAVDAGFVGDGHASVERSRFPTVTYLVRTFVNV